MYLGRVVGCVWSTMKDANLVGQRLLIVRSPPRNSNSISPTNDASIRWNPGARPPCASDDVHNGPVYEHPHP